MWHGLLQLGVRRPNAQDLANYVPCVQILTLMTWLPFQQAPFCHRHSFSALKFEGALKLHYPSWRGSLFHLLWLWPSSLSRLITQLRKRNVYALRKFQPIVHCPLVPEPLACIKLHRTWNRINATALLSKEPERAKSPNRLSCKLAAIHDQKRGGGELHQLAEGRTPCNHIRWNSPNLPISWPRA